MQILLVIDMQNDFITGSLGTPEAVQIVPAVQQKIAQCRARGAVVIFTRDTHGKDYLATQEGKYLPVEHCIKGTLGHEITSALQVEDAAVVDKPHFGSLELPQYLKRLEAEYNQSIMQIELCGLCTDICVASNALLLKPHFPEARFIVDARCCAGVTVESHQAALLTMKMCQIEIEGALDA